MNISIITYILLEKTEEEKKKDKMIGSEFWSTLSDENQINQHETHFEERCTMPVNTNRSRQAICLRAKKDAHISTIMFYVYRHSNEDILLKRMCIYRKGKSQK